MASKMLTVKEHCSELSMGIEMWSLQMATVYSFIKKKKKKRQKNPNQPKIIRA